ncbi:MAG: SpoIIE family protein phosphatase [Peptoniphilus sp.]|nr:SpoIIE family protein phosphatase [Peptoniphilus sp.]MDD7362582.1 SpoIIE family protein phosphatase [Bacillota bacterium]MDY6045019.1 SpoIIE family protein phosphatase [Peptoniphilus sp.]
MKDRDLLYNQIDTRLLDTMSDLIRIVDEDNAIVYYNRAMRIALEDQMFRDHSEGEDGGFSDFRMTARSIASGEIIQRETYVGDVYYSVKTNPIRGNDGSIVGAIEVFRDKSIEKHLQLEQIEKNRAMIEEQISASNIQHALLPKRGYNRLTCMEYYYRPAEILSGDIFDFIEIDDDHAAFYIADVVGHGFASSMMTMFISQTLRNMAPEILKDPTVAMLEIEHRFAELNFPDTMYFTIFLAVYSENEHKLTYVNAGHDCPPLLKRGENVRLLLNTGFPISSLVEASFYECRTAYLFKGDELLLYTDGITECRNKNRVQFGVKNLQKTFAETDKEPLAEIVETLRKYVHEEIVDDMTCVYLRML